MPKSFPTQVEEGYKDLSTGAGVQNTVRGIWAVLLQNRRRTISEIKQPRPTSGILYLFEITVSFRAGHHLITGINCV